jgi:quinoprotein glucose dehydrogenase
MKPTRLHASGFLTALVILAAVAAGGQSPPTEKPYTTWRDYGGSADSMQYSALTQINKTNVSQLELAWFYPVSDRTGAFGFNPIVIDGVMYVLGPRNGIFALDAATGAQIWAHGVEDASPGNRGINYWESKDRSDRRLVFGAGGYLYALDARTGREIPTFGVNGRVDMRDGPLRPLGGPSGTAGRTFENLFITGSTTGEGYGSTPGDLRAFDIVTGKLVWTFHTIPHPGEFGYDTWPAAPTPGARSRSTRRAASRISRSGPRPTIRLAAIARAPTSLRTPCSRSTRAPASGYGTSRPSITTSGTTT